MFSNSYAEALIQCRYPSAPLRTFEIVESTYINTFGKHEAYVIIKHYMNNEDFQKEDYAMYQNVAYFSSKKVAEDALLIEKLSS